ncbi:MAG: transposase [Bacteroidota bacterium]
MKYNPTIHHRRSIRLKGYDYSQSGAYFITICCQDMKHRFGKIENGEMILNEYGIIAYNEWGKLSERFLNFELDVFQIMPNHLHGIIILTDIVRATLAVAQNPAAQNSIPKITPDQNEFEQITNDDINLKIGQNQNGQPHLNTGQPQGIAPTSETIAIKTNATIGDIVGAYKSLVANACLDIYKMKNETMGKLWQRNYYEHIIRNEQSCKTISEYIINNPAKWKNDKFYK